MSGHTPGPWSVSMDLDLWPLVMAGGKIVANVNPESFYAGVADFVDMPADGNARLISAAPDMLSALNLINVDKDGDGFICREAMYQVRAAIARATVEAAQ